MREILDAVYGLLIVPEPEDPLDSILAEEFLTSRENMNKRPRKTRRKLQGIHDDMEQKLVGEELTKKFTPSHLVCPLTKKMFIDPVKNQDGTVYERKAIEKHLKMQRTDPKTKKLLSQTDLKSDTTMQKMAREHRKKEYLETSV
nr:U-box domain-containing protein 35 [Salvelinus alpinus]